MKKKNIAILGSTGSIGTQALEVIEANSNLFSAEVLTANSNAELLIEQSKKFVPNVVVIADEQKYEMVREALYHLPIKVFAGKEAINQVVEMNTVDMVLTALVGYAGLLPTIKAIENKKPIALANKETLVIAGELVNSLVQKYKVPLIPVDSEHSAIFQCLAGEEFNPIEKIYLTASGGPFRGQKKDFLQNVTVAQALNHPNWSMGAKITIDSATLMNKGFEAIEAKWLFHLQPEQIDVVIHPQSIIHSIVQFTDGSMKAQMGLPTMKLPIQYAFTYPFRIKSDFARFNFLDYPTLTFETPDTENFPCLRISYETMRKGGNAACVLNAANEAAVAAFLKEKISFLKIPFIIEKTLEKISYIPKPNLNDYIETDRESRLFAESLI